MNSAKLVMLANNISPKLARVMGRTGFHIHKQRPNILFGVGIVGSVASTVLACRATLKLSETMAEIESDFDVARNFGSDREVTYTYLRSGVKLGRLYGPSVAVGVVSISCLSGAHVDLTRRNASLVAAYTTLQSAFDNYRDRVRDGVGSDRELDLYNGLVESKTDEGDVVKELKDPNGLSPYARFFDEVSPNWEKNAENNRLFLMCQQNYANELLRARGHLFLNEVYDMLGIERSSAGQVVGWIINGEGDDYVDFGMYATNNNGFINGWEPRVLLDFNVDGLVFNKIDP